MSRQSFDINVSETQELFDLNEHRSPIRRMIEAVGRTSYDSEYRERFLADPRAALAEENFEVDPEIEIVLHMEEPKKLFITVPVFDDSPVELPSDHPIFDEKYDPKL